MESHRGKMRSAEIINLWHTMYSVQVVWLDVSPFQHILGGRGGGGGLCLDSSALDMTVDSCFLSFTGY